MLIRDNVYNFWIKMPIGDELSNLDPDARYEIDMLDTLIPSCGFVDHDPTKLIYCTITTDHEKPLFLIEALIVSFSLLGWEVYYGQSAWDKVDVLNDDGEVVGKVPEALMILNKDIYTYIEPRYNTDAEGNQTTQKPYDTSMISVYFGHAKVFEVAA